MARNKERESKVLGQIAAINTLLERYPVLVTSDPLLTNFSLNSSIGLLLDFMNILGLSQNDIINWICKVFDGKDGLLEQIEYAIKGILLVNVKNILTCAINPNIPDEVLKYANQLSGPDPGSNPLRINLKAVDMFGLLANCPSNEDESVFYFDAYEKGYRPNELYKSKDFNAYLWYVINKGNTTSITNTLKNTWDNRIKAGAAFEHNTVLEDTFFDPQYIIDGGDATKGPVIPVNTPEGSVDKKQFIICEYSESFGGEIMVFLNANRYYRTRHIGQLTMNRTWLEFNYDYIYSLKLFDTKTLLANVCNSILGLTASISASMSFEQRIVKERIEKMVENIMNSDDIEEDYCYNLFSNDEYDRMLEETTKQYNGLYTPVDGTHDPAYDNVYEALRNINSETTTQEETRTYIRNVIEATLDASVIKQGIESELKFNYSVDFITEFLKQTITQIILHVLSPKVAILYGINSAIMGDVSKVDDFETFFKSFINLMVSIIRQVKDILVKAMYDWIMSQLKPLLELFIAKLAIETIKDYKDLINNLILNCVPNFAGGIPIPTTIDNVNYADIVPSKDHPTEKTNC